MHWRNDRDLSGFNILNMGIWYEAMIRWVGRANNVMAMTSINASHRTDEEGNRVPVSIPDHVDILAGLANGAQASLRFSAVTGLGPGNDVWIYGSEGTLRLDSGPERLGRQARRTPARGNPPIPPKDKPTGGWKRSSAAPYAARKESPAPPSTSASTTWSSRRPLPRSAQTGQAVALPL